jgi:hypothetical protein
MRTWTNLTWPDDPYRTGQQLYRRPMPRLAAFTIGRTGDDHPVPAAVAIVYLPLHRTHAVCVTERTLMFGFRSASADDPADTPALAAIADLDLMRARRQAAVLAGYRLPDDLSGLRQAGHTAQLRGLSAVEHEWLDRGTVTGRAEAFDCAVDLPSRPPLEVACEQAGISTGLLRSDPGAGGPAGLEAAVLAVARALMIALVCARHLGRYEWAATLSIGQVMAATAWDCLPLPEARLSATRTSQPCQGALMTARGNLT